MSKKNFSVILSGCGVYDGSEINEVVLTLLALELNGIQYQCFAPDIDQYHVIDHTSGEVLNEKRNVLKEAARIVRGNIKPITECDVNNFAAVIVPGGLGVAKNLSTYAFDGKDLTIEENVLKVLKEFKNAGKPAGYICIAPVLLPIIYGPGVILTLGNNKETIAIVEKLGAIHKIAEFSDIVVDDNNKVVTTPAYMLANSISKAQCGINKLVAQLAKMSNEPFA